MTGKKTHAEAATSWTARRPGIAVGVKRQTLTGAAF